MTSLPRTAAFSFFPTDLATAFFFPFFASLTAMPNMFVSAIRIPPFDR